MPHISRAMEKRKLRELKFRKRAGRVSVTIYDVNDPPLATNDELTVGIDDRTSPDVLADDSLDVLSDDPPQLGDGETLTIVEVGPTDRGGVVVIQDSPSLLYTPRARFASEESVTYTISDGREWRGEHW